MTLTYVCQTEESNKISSLTFRAAYTNNEINSEKNLYMVFSCRWGAPHRKIDHLLICPPNIILDLFHLLVIPYTCLPPKDIHFLCENYKFKDAYMVV